MEEKGTPVPVDFRPPGSENDVLCEWRLGYLRDEKNTSIFAQGTFGKVLGVKTESGRQVAVKIMEKSKISPEENIARELKLLQECSVHPHVVDLLGYVNTTKSVYMLMPLADSDVAAMIKSSTRPNEERTSYMTGQVVSAVESLHERSIVHRDMRPSIFLYSPTS